jgi:hypothetical protein
MSSKKEEKKSKISGFVPLSLHKKVRMHKAETGETINQIVEKALKQYLK